MNKQRRQFAILAVVVLALLVIYFLANKKSSKQEAFQQYTAEAPGTTFHGIPPEGNGGDPDLNKQKNRWSEPYEIHTYTVDEIKALPHDKLDAAGKEKREHWSYAALRQATTNEVGAGVEGYVIAAKESGPESCNGHSDVYKDFHIWIGSTPNASKSESVIVEMTPYWKEKNPDWTIRWVESLAARHARVVLRGWILWDEEHAEEVGRSRGSQWEVHPVTTFDVKSETEID